MAKSIGTRFLSTVGAGILGSALTLGVVTNTDLLTAKEESAASGSSNVKPYSVQQTSTKSPLPLSDMVEQSSSAIVGIVNFQDMGNRFTQETQSVEAGSGSGVVYAKDGDKAFIVTNNHVINDAKKLEIVFQNGKKTTAEVIGSDALTDLAVLKIDATNVESVLDFGDSDTLRAGDSVVAIGNPLGLDFSGTVTQGIVSAVNRAIDVNTASGQWTMNVIQTDAAINPGNSGGALLNAEGKVVGINSLKISENGVEGLGFAIPSNEVVPLLKEMTENGGVERAYLGIGPVDLGEVPEQYVRDLPQSVTGGVMVASVDPKSAAAKAGIAEQDVITAINGEAITNSAVLRKFLYTDLSIGDKVKMTVYKGADKRTVELTLTSK